MAHTAQMSCALARQRDKAPAGVTHYWFSKRIISESELDSRAHAIDSLAVNWRSGVCNDYPRGQFTTAPGAKREILFLLIRAPATRAARARTRRVVDR